MSPREALIEVRKLVEVSWTKRAFARDKHGVVCSPISTEARSFCFIGAMRKVGKYDPISQLGIRTPDEITTLIQVVNTVLGELYPDIAHMAHLNDKYEDNTRILRVIDTSLERLSE